MSEWAVSSAPAARPGPAGRHSRLRRAMAARKETICQLAQLFAEELEHPAPASTALKGLEELKGIKGLEELKGIKGLKELNGIKGLEELKGLKGLEELKGIKGLEELNGPNVEEEPRGLTELERLRAENERLRAQEAVHIQERTRLLLLVRDLRRELEETGRALRGHTAVLRSVGTAVTRNGPHQMIRQRRGEESEGSRLQRSERLEGSVRVLRERECGLSSSMRSMEDRHRAARLVWDAQEKELKRYVAVLEAHTTRMERQLPPGSLRSATLFNMTMCVLSCEGLFNRRNNGTGFIDPFVVLYGPCGERILETLPCEDTDCPSFSPGANTVTIKAVRDTPWAVVVEVYSRGANDARLFLGRAALPLGPLVAEFSGTEKCKEKVLTLPLFPRERELDPDIVSHADELGSVVLSVAAASIGAGIKRCDDSRASSTRNSIVSHTLPNSTNRAMEDMRFVRVAGGRGVLKRDVHVKSHPYLIARRGVVELLRTAPAAASRNPFWDCEPFAVQDLCGPPIVFEVYDHSGDGNTDDDFLGEAQLTSKELMSKDEWFELVLRPRRNEPLSYIRRYHDCLGKILVQCTRERHSVENRRVKWSRRQSLPSSVVKCKPDGLPGEVAGGNVRIPQATKERSAKLQNCENAAKEKLKPDTEIELHVASDSSHSQYQPESLAETQHPTPLIPPSPVFLANSFSSAKEPAKMMKSEATSTAVATEEAPPLPVEGIVSSNVEKENEGHTSLSKTPNRSALDPIRLCIYVKEGKDLLDCDQAMFNVFGVTDPRVLVWIGPDCVFTVREKRETVNPKWNKEEGEFFANVQMNQIIRFEVQDVDISGFDSLGTATVHVSDILERVGEHSLPVVLNGKQYGTLTVIFELGS